MPTVKRSLIKGTESTQSVVGNEFHSAVIRFRVLDLTYTDPTVPGGFRTVEQRLEEAIQEVRDSGNFESHPEISILNLQRARARLIGHRIAIVDLIYQNVTGGGFTPQPTTATAHFRTGLEPIEIFTSGIDSMGNPVFDSIAGLPGPEDGVTNPFDDVNAWYKMSPSLIFEDRVKPHHWIWNRPVISFVITTTLSFNPVQNVNVIALRHGKTNSDTLLFRGTVFDPNTIRFDGADITEIVVGNPNVGGRVFYEVDYRFTAAFGGWYRQRPWFDDTTPLLGNWRVAIEEVYQRTPFLTPPFPLIG